VSEILKTLTIKSVMKNLHFIHGERGRGRRNETKTTKVFKFLEKCVREV